MSARQPKTLVVAYDVSDLTEAEADHLMGEALDLEDVEVVDGRVVWHGRQGLRASLR